jgi:hypothetical protein
MPEIANLFGTASQTVTGASLAERHASSARTVDTGTSPRLDIPALTIAPLEIEPIRIPVMSTADQPR